MFAVKDPEQSQSVQDADSPAGPSESFYLIVLHDLIDPYSYHCADQLLHALYEDGGVVGVGRGKGAWLVDLSTQSVELISASRGEILTGGPINEGDRVLSLEQMIDAVVDMASSPNVYVAAYALEDMDPVLERGSKVRDYRDIKTLKQEGVEAL